MKSNNKSRAFSLVELLVVMAVIAILAMLLLPAVAAAKARAKQIACLSNLKQWNLAALMYEDDEGDLLPREKSVDGDHTRADLLAPANQDVWFNALPPAYMGEPGASNYANDLASFHSSRLFQCPSARLPSDLVEPRFSLAMNSQLSKGTNVLLHVRFSSLQNPAQTVLFLECGVVGETPQVCPAQKPYNARPYSWAVRLSGRHQRGSNLTFGDGHAQWYSGLQVVDPATGQGYPPPAEVQWTP